MNRLILFLLIIISFSCSMNPPDQLSRISFTKPEANPIIHADSTFTFTDPVKGEIVKWQKADVFNPAAIVKDDRVYLLLRCEDNPAAHLGGRTSRIGLAYSDDGINFTKHPEPVLYPDNDEYMIYDYPGGCEDPRVVQVNDSLYVMTYTSWNHTTARLSIAFSKDLLVWEKKGPAFARAYEGKFLDIWSKSGSIVTKYENGKPVAARVNGKYLMYWGEKFMNLALSENLSDWIPSVGRNGELKQIVNIRPGKFDSDLVECGPPAIINKEGIVLFYNGKNASGNNSDKNLPESTYSVGRVVFDINDPEKVVSRTDTCILRPTLPHEVTGQYAAGTTFGEGLVWFIDRWFLYYGTADSYVGVAVSGEEKKN